MAVPGGRGGNLGLQAVQYARQYLAPWAGQYMEVRYGGTGGGGNLRLQAVQYTRQYLAPWAGQYMEVRLGCRGCRRRFTYI